MRSFQAGRMPARRWRDRRGLSWSLAGDDVAVAHGFVTYGKLEYPVDLSGITPLKLKLQSR
jgi:hypothetical protein